MPLEEKCEIASCSRTATRITSTESKYIVICEECSGAGLIFFGDNNDYSTEPCDCEVLV